MVAYSLPRFGPLACHIVAPVRLHEVGSPVTAINRALLLCCVTSGCTCPCTRHTDIIAPESLRARLDAARPFPERKVADLMCAHCRAGNGTARAIQLCITARPCLVHHQCQPCQQRRPSSPRCCCRPASDRALTDDDTSARGVIHLWF
jgi:hypothetical protein